MLTTSASLLARLRQPGDRESWDRFVTLYTPLLMFWARRAGLAHQDAADLVQDVFVALLERLPEFSYDGRSFRGWLRTVLMNKWRDRVRNARPTQALNAHDPPAADDSLEALWDAEHQRLLLAAALEIMKSEFTENTWRACWETVVQDRPVPQVARELGVTENVVYIARSRVLRRLRAELDGLLD
jgi:RNA polymerase sigma-70 factor (ECF subfamily)